MPQRDLHGCHRGRDRRWLAIGLALSSHLAWTAPALAGGWTEILRRWMDSSQDPKDRGGGAPGGRRGDTCWITPTAQLWHDRPWLVWRGRTGAVGLKAQDGSAVTWRPTPPARAEGHFKLQVPVPLRAGQAYDWLFFFDSATPSPMLRVPFQVMSEPARSLITADLQALTARLTAQGASPETIAQHRAEYFARQQLWADVLQEVYAVEQPSGELQSFAQQVTTKLCE